MVNLLWWLAIIVGLILVLLGAVSIIARHRWAHNFTSSGLARNSSSAIAYAVSVGMSQLILGIFLVVVGLLRSESLGRVGILYSWTAESLGSLRPIVSIALFVFSAGLVVLGVVFIRKAWRGRESWNKQGDRPVHIPSADRHRIVFGTLCSVFGVFGAIAGMLLMVVELQ